MKQEDIPTLIRLSHLGYQALKAAVPWLILVCAVVLLLTLAFGNLTWVQAAFGVLMSVANWFNRFADQGMLGIETKYGCSQWTARPPKASRGSNRRCRQHKSRGRRIVVSRQPAFTKQTERLMAP